MLAALLLQVTTQATQAATQAAQVAQNAATQAAQATTTTLDYLAYIRFGLAVGTALFAVAGAYWYIRVRLRVLEKEVEDLRGDFDREVEVIEKNLERMELTQAENAKSFKEELEAIRESSNKTDIKIERVLAILENRRSPLESQL